MTDRQVFSHEILHTPEYALALDVHDAIHVFGLCTPIVARQWKMRFGGCRRKPATDVNAQRNWERLKARIRSRQVPGATFVLVEVPGYQCTEIALVFSAESQAWCSALFRVHDRMKGFLEEAGCGFVDDPEFTDEELQMRIEMVRNGKRVS